MENILINNLIELSIRYERSRSAKTKLVAKLKAGKIEATLLPDRTKKEIKKRRLVQSINK